MRLFAQAFICITVALTVAVNQKDGDEGRPYEFGFTIDGQQHRHEKKDENGIIQGEFGFITADGVYHVTVYATDENGNFKILSMRNIRISAPLDGSPALGPISPEAGKYLRKLGQTAPAAPAAPQPVQKFERLQEQPKPPAITEPPKKFYDFTTKPTIKPACGGCGYVTTSKPFTLQYQNPAYQKPSVQVQGPNLTQNSIVSQQPQTQPAVQTGYNNNAGQKPTSQQNGFFNQQSQNLPVTPANQQQISVQQTAVQTGYNNNPSQQPTSQPNGFFNQPSQNLPVTPTSLQQQISVQQPQLPTYNQNQNRFIGQQPQIFRTETPTYQTGFINQQPQVPSTVQIGVPQIPFSGQNNFIPSVPSVQPSGFSQGPGRLPVQPQGLLQTPPDVELLSPGSFPQTPGNNVQIQQQQPAFTPFGNQQSSFSKPNGIQTHGSLIQPFSPQTQNGYDPVDISQGPSALNSPPFVNTPSRQNQQEPTSKLPPITLSDNVIHVGGKKPQDIPIQDKFPGMADGLPDGVDDTDVKDILYKFKYIVGFHGHYEKGLKNGAKIGGYFVNGRDGISRVVTYVADEYGYRPKFKFINLGLDSPDTPKEGTEKTFGLKSFEFVWYPIE